MTSGFYNNFLLSGNDSDAKQQQQQPSMVGGIQGGVSPYGVRQPRQQGGVFSTTTGQISQRRSDLLMGKRSFSDYQHQLLLLQHHQQQQQQQQQSQSLFQQHQHQHQHQHQYLMRSVKQRTGNNNNHSFVSSPISPLTPSLDLPFQSSFTTRFGVPVYQQPQQKQPQPVSFLNQTNQIKPTNNLLTQVQNGSGFSSGVGYANMGSNLIQQQQSEPVSVPGMSFSNPVQIKSDPDNNQKMFNTLQELENQLLNDDDDDENHNEGDGVSVITNSEWSETFQNLTSPGLSPSPDPTPAQNPNLGSTSTSGSNNNNNNMISPSPTSSTSSCCSTSASPVMPVVSSKQLILEIGMSISEGKTDLALDALARLSQVSNSRGNSEQRLSFYMCNALKSRACPNENPPPIIEMYGKNQMCGMYALYEFSPCFKFALLAANHMMLEAIASALQEGLQVHVIDFHVGYRGQYVTWLRALSECRSQNGAATELRITVVDIEAINGMEIESESAKIELLKLAQGLGIRLRFDVIRCKITELTRHSLSCVDGEAIVVNFAFKLYRVPDESVSMENLRDELVRRMKGLSPRAVTLVEQDMNANTAPFMTRVNEACGYYGALFDSLEATLPRDSRNRAQIEEAMGQKIGNSLACEGRERVERAEVFGKWRARMGMAGLGMKGLNQSVAESMRANLNSARGGNPGFTVQEENGGVGIGWMGRTLTVASYWR